MAFKALLNNPLWPIAPKVTLLTWLPFPRLCSSLLCHYCSKKKPPERAFTKMRLHKLSILTITCVGTTIHLRLIKSSLPSPYPLRHWSDKLFQALSHFSILQAMESRAGPGNEARTDKLSTITMGLLDIPSYFAYKECGATIYWSAHPKNDRHTRTSFKQVVAHEWHTHIFA